MGNLCSQLEVRDPETYQVNLEHFQLLFPAAAAACHT